MCPIIIVFVRSYKFGFILLFIDGILTFLVTFLSCGCELLCTVLDRIAAHCIGKNELHCVCFSEMFLWLVEYATFVQCDLCWLAVTSRQIFSVYRHLKIAFNWIQSDEYIYFALRLSLLSFSCNDCFLVFFLFFLNLIYSIKCFFKLVTTLLLIPIKKISLLTLI